MTTIAKKVTNHIPQFSVSGDVSALEVLNGQWVLNYEDCEEIREEAQALIDGKAVSLYGIETVAYGAEYALYKPNSAEDGQALERLIADIRKAVK